MVLFMRVFCRSVVAVARAVLELIFVRNGSMSVLLDLDCVDINVFITSCVPRVRFNNKYI